VEKFSGRIFTAFIQIEKQIRRRMATDIKEIINNLLDFYDFNNRTIITVGAGGGQLIEYGKVSKKVFAIDFDEASLQKLKENLIRSGLDDKFTLVHSDFYLSNLRGDVVLFEFCFHEMEDPEAALKHALTMAPNVIILDHWADSEWAYFGGEEDFIAKSWATAKRFHLIKVQKFDTFQFFNDYEEIYQKVKLQGETSINRINDFKDKRNFTIPMSVGIWIKLPFPSGDYSSSQAITQNIYCSSGHVHQLINAKNNINWPGRKPKASSRSQQDYQRSPWYAGYSLTCQHQSKYDQELFFKG
jgi:predicted RNA methylase